MSALLKILSGPQEGAESPLAPGSSYVLGSGDEADIILAGAGVASRHATLWVEEGGFRVEPAEGAETRVDGAPVTGATALAAGQVLTLGGVHLAVGPDGPWASLPVPPVPPAGAPAPAPEDAPAAGPDFPPATPAPGGSAAAPAKPPARSPLPMAAAAAAVLALVALAAALAWSRGGGGEPPAERTARRLREAGIPARPMTEEELRRAPPPGGSVATLAGGRGRVGLAGLLAGDAERQAVLDAAGPGAEPWAEGLRTVAEALEEARGPLAGAYPGLALEQEGNRHAATLSGIVDRASDGQNAFRRARSLVDGRIALRRGLWPWPELRREAETAAAHAGMAGATFVREEGTIRARAAPWPDAGMREDFGQRLAERAGARAAGLFAGAFEAGPPAVAVRDVTPPPPTVQIIPPPEERGGGNGDPDPDPAGKEPAPEALPETGEDPRDKNIDEPEMPAPPPRWLVARLSGEGFYDQDGNFFAAGVYLTPSLRLVRTWSGGVVLQRGSETILAPSGSTVVDMKDEGK